ncbi:monovalent cation:proton antiporter (CPA2 family) [Legionella wadsworthii]|uniref:Monovalent cation:proton antiporter (CPA2 family) n=1 Tax=Legionella wadsworthii TaxID=28088 RepID=A0A378LXX0_9GAMM|nr:cation:proton antiporter [Legionella wadsworthii]STY31333.1 monovalent cation:proton antiporter (CPA2 family) [Legionella wadsworthii]
MHHSLPLISTLAAALGLSLLLGFLATKLKLPTIIGYLLAGILIGPFTPGFVANTALAGELAEIGIMLLMFGVGLHFSFEQLLETRKISLPGALIQIIVASLMGGGLALFWGWHWGAALVFGLALSVASTVVLINALKSFDILNTKNGQIAIGWLIVEDLAMVLALVFLPLLSESMGGNSNGAQSKSLLLAFGTTLLEIGSFFIVMFIFGRWMIPKLLWHIARTGSHELFTLAIIAAAVGIAFGASKIFNISFALGAFFAGMIMRESKFSLRAAEESLPFRDAFAVLFFVSIGMLFNPFVFLHHPFQVLAVALIIIIGKSIAASFVVLLLRYPLNTALVVSASLAQIGEFSFILGGLSVQMKLLPKEGLELIIAGSLLSICLNPFLFKCIKPLEKRINSKCSWVESKEEFDNPSVQVPLTTEEKFLSGQIVLVGYGRVGKRIARFLERQGLSYVIVDQDRNLIEELREKNKLAVYGDATRPNGLIKEHIAKAGMLVIATAGSFNMRQIIDVTLKINPKIEVAIRTIDEKEALLLKQEVKGKFFFNERELAQGMSRYILYRFGVKFPGKH